MRKRSKVNLLIILIVVISSFIVGCSSSDTKESKGSNVAINAEDETKILASTLWQGTKVYGESGKDLSEYNQNFIGLARYDKVSGMYEFFDKETGKSRGDYGSFFVTNDGKKRVLVSQGKGYFAVVDLVNLNEGLFTYKRMGKDENGNPVMVYVDHIPYEGSHRIRFTHIKTYDHTTGQIVKGVDGDIILGDTLWMGTKVVDKDGNDLTEYNKGYISIAKYDTVTNKYEFYDKETKESKGDYGYFNVSNGNKIRSHVSLGKGYSAILELTEINKGQFTYRRKGKDSRGNSIYVYVEHVPYTGDQDLPFSF